MITRSFQGYAPPPRYDADPYTKVKIEESDAIDGTFLVIETITLSPVDPDPTKPLVRDFSTDSATQEPGWYKLVWEDASGDTATSASIYVPIMPTWTPSVAEVAALIRARTKVAGGKELGTFTEDTRPTAADVERLIQQAVRRVATNTGADPCTANLQLDATAAAALYTAMLIEQSYFPEQTTGTSGNSFTSLEKLWKDQISMLTTAVGEQCGGSGEAPGGGDQMPAADMDDGFYLISRTYPAW